MKEKTINKNFSFAVGPYSPGVKAGQYLFTSGQLSLDPRTGEVVEGGIETQTKQALENLKTVLESHSVSLEDVVKVTVFLKNMDDFTRFNQVYADYFKEKLPARSCVEVSRLAKDAAVEIEAIALIKT